MRMDPFAQWCRRPWRSLTAVVFTGLIVGCGAEESSAPRPAFTATALVEGATDGRSVWVRVLDQNAEPIDGASVSVQLESGDVRDAVEVGRGEHRIDGLLEGVVPIQVQAGGREHLLKHAIENPYATLVLPVGGELDVVWQAPQLAGLPDGDLYLVVVARLDPELRFEIPLEQAESYTGRASIPYLMPGQYLASLELWRVPEPADGMSDADAAVLADAEEAPVKILPLTQPRLVWIAPGEAAQIVLGSPTVADAPRP